MDFSYDVHFEQLDNFFNNITVTDKSKQQCEEEPIYTCRYCKNIDTIIYDYINATEICKVCGVIINKLDDHNPEWRYYGASDNKNTNPTRCGNPVNPLLPKSSMGTMMSYGCGKYKNLSRLHMWNQMPSDERSLYDVFKKIDKYIQKTAIAPIIANETKKYYKLLSEKEDKIRGYLTRGNIRTSLIAACLFIACKNNKKPMREVEIANIFGIDPTDVTKGLKKFSNLEKNKNLQINTCENNIHDYIAKYSNKLNISQQIIKIAHLLYIRINALNILKNNNYTSICSGLLFYIIELFQLNIKKINIISIINISEVTLNKVYKEIIKHEQYLLIGFDKIKFITQYTTDENTNGKRKHKKKSHVYYKLV